MDVNEELKTEVRIDVNEKLKLWRKCKKKSEGIRGWGGGHGGCE